MCDNCIDTNIGLVKCRTTGLIQRHGDGVWEVWIDGDVYCHETTFQRAIEALSRLI